MPRQRMFATFWNGCKNRFLSKGFRCSNLIWIHQVMGWLSNQRSISVWLVWNQIKLDKCLIETHLAHLPTSLLACLPVECRILSIWKFWLKTWKFGCLLEIQTFWNPERSRFNQENAFAEFYAFNLWLLIIHSLDSSAWQLCCGLRPCKRLDHKVWSTNFEANDLVEFLNRNSTRSFGWLFDFS